MFYYDTLYGGLNVWAWARESVWKERNKYILEKKKEVYLNGDLCDCIPLIMCSSHRVHKMNTR
jgi:hypothetical protein